MDAKMMERVKDDRQEGWEKERKKKLELRKIKETERWVTRK